MTDLSKTITDLALVPRRTLLKGTAGILAAGIGRRIIRRCRRLTRCVPG